MPKKTRLYVEQTDREREQAGDMHRVFQRELCKLRLATSRAYVKVWGCERGKWLRVRECVIERHRCHDAGLCQSTG